MGKRITASDVARVLYPNPDWAVVDVDAVNGKIHNVYGPFDEKDEAEAWAKRLNLKEPAVFPMYQVRATRNESDG